MAKKPKTDPKVEVKKGLFGRTKTMETYGNESDYTYKDVTRNKKGDIVKVKEGVYKETPTETIDKGSVTNRKGKTRYYDRGSTNINSPEERMVFPGMKKGGPVTALDQVDKMYKAKYKKK
jgi:hypothetical protein